MGPAGFEAGAGIAATKPVIEGYHGLKETKLEQLSRLLQGHQPSTRERRAMLMAGTLETLERTLGIRRDEKPPVDAVFVSLDLKNWQVRKTKTNLSTTRTIRQATVVTLDTRDLLRLQPLSELERLMSIRFFQMRGPKSRPTKTHPTLRPLLVSRENMVRNIADCLRIPDTKAEDGRLRKIIVVGHSIWDDIYNLAFLGLDITQLREVLTVLDTHDTARYLFPPYSISAPILPGQRFTLASILARFKCRPRGERFHTAATDAKLSLYAMLLLAIKSGESRRDELSMIEQGKLQKIKQAVALMVYGHSEISTLAPPQRPTPGSLLWHSEVAPVRQSRRSAQLGPLIQVPKERVSREMEGGPS